MDKKEKKRTIFVVIGTILYVLVSAVVIYFSVDIKAKQNELVIVAEHLVKLEKDNLNYNYKELNIYHLKKDKFIEIIYFDAEGEVYYFADLKNNLNSKETEDYDDLYLKFSQIKTNYKKVIKYETDDINKIIGK